MEKFSVQNYLMPQISYFLGVIIRMFYRDHNPPHFHAVNADFEGIIDFEKMKSLVGIFHLEF